VLLISVLFGLKALYLAFWVTPLWDIPDEIGHFAYVRDIAEGRGIPLLGEAEIGADIIAHAWHDPQASPRGNWIAQHPPVYYVLAAIPYKIGTCLTGDVEVLYRLPRLASALSGALLLLVLFRTLRAVGLDARRAGAIAAALGFIPMVSHLSSGTNQDVPLLLFCALATHYWARYLVERRTRFAYLCALWLTVAGGTKMTAWVILAPMVLILLVEMPGPIRTRLWHAAGVCALAISAPAAWMIRNMLHFGNPFFVSGSGSPGMAEPLGHSFFYYLHFNPVLEHFIQRFYGMFGHLGTGRGGVLLCHAEGLPLDVFSVLLWGLASVAVAYVGVLACCAMRPIRGRITDDSVLGWMSGFLERHRCARALVIVSFLGALLLSASIGMASYKVDSLPGNLRIWAVVLLVFASLAGAALLFLTPDPADRVALYGLAVLLFFSAVLLYRVYGAYLGCGFERAIHGRYFYPVVPGFLLSIAIALKRLRMPACVAVAVALALACMELDTFVLQAIPFYLGQ
jgi:hypothetical protein